MSRPSSPLRVDASTPVVVLRVLAGRLPHGGLGAVRTLGRLGVPVHVAHHDPCAALARSRFVRGMARWPEGAEDRRVIDALHHLADRLGGRPVLLPTDDAGANLVDDHADELATSFVFPTRPPGLCRRLSDKRGLHELCLELGVPAPAAAYPVGRGDARAFAASAAFPVVVKSIRQELQAARGAPSVAIVERPDDLLAFYDAFEDPARPNLLFQEHIPGGPESVWMFNGYFDHRSECRFGATGRKLRQHPPYTGMTTLGVCERNPTVWHTTVRMMRTLGYRGPLDIGFRFDARDGRYKLLDANPRVGATFRLFAGVGGLDVVRAAYLDLTGQDVPADRVPDGRRWILESHDPLSAATYVRDGRLNAVGWARSLAGIREAALFASDDPRPFLSVAWRLGRRRLRATVERRRRPVMA